MLIEVRVPALAESVAEATLMDWHKQPGDAVKFGEALIDVETDKITLEVVAPEDGVLTKILKDSRADVQSNELIAQIDNAQQGAVAADTRAADNSEAVGAGRTEPTAPRATTAEDHGKSTAGAAQTETTVTAANTAETAQQTMPMDEPRAPAENGTEVVADTSAVKAASDDDARDAASADETEAGATARQAAPKLSPAVRQLLRKHDLEAIDIPISGDRLTKEQVLQYLDARDAPDRQPESAVEPRPPAPTEPKAAPEHATATGNDRPTAAAPEATAAPEQATTGAGAQRRTPMSRLRRRVAERLLAAQHENAILTTFNEINMQPVQVLRERYRDDFEKRHGVRLGYMSFFTKAVVEALKKHPIINASVDGTDIIYHDYYDLGIAVSSPRGLVVPIIRQADTLSFAQIEKTISDYGHKAREARLSIEELTGGTFTITNGGIFGSMLSTPIINPPQSAILGMHKIEARPVAEDGAVVIRPMMYLALSYDHRIIDGRDAVSFLVAIKELLEDPSRLLLQV